MPDDASTSRVQAVLSDVLNTANQGHYVHDDDYGVFAAHVIDGLRDAGYVVVHDPERAAVFGVNLEPDGPR